MFFGSGESLPTNKSPPHNSHYKNFGSKAILNILENLPATQYFNWIQNSVLSTSTIITVRYFLIYGCLRKLYHFNYCIPILFLESDNRTVAFVLIHEHFLFSAE